jgi:glycine cleavage system aminomethyltransferase T
MSNWSPVETLVWRAGGVLPSRSDVRVATHFGSPAGELAACLRGVGLADRSDLGVLRITAAPARVSELAERISGSAPAIGGVVATADVWWCRESGERLVAVAEPAARARLLAWLRTPGPRLHGVEVDDLSAGTAAIAVVGLRAAEVLAALGALGPAGDPRKVSPFSAETIDGVPVQLLLQSDRRALLLVGTDDAAHVWHAVESAGRPYALSLIGTDALHLLALHERTATTQSAALTRV